MPFWFYLYHLDKNLSAQSPIWLITSWFNNLSPNNLWVQNF
ncbi:hypothetical protein [Vibrio gallaecicus]|nr:hypothetical protein [Vibrio gallaecicus]MDN3614957.1 hypothetical protein [Vibrio gallaecicus]